MRKTLLLLLLAVPALGGGGWAAYRGHQAELEAARHAAEEAQRRVDEEHRQRVNAALAAIHDIPQRVGYHGQFGDEMVFDYAKVERGYTAFLLDFPDDRLPEEDKAVFARALCASGLLGNGGTINIARSFGYGGCAKYRDIWHNECSANLDGDAEGERGFVINRLGAAVVFVVDDDDSVGELLYEGKPPGGVPVGETVLSCSDGLLIWGPAGRGPGLAHWKWDGTQLARAADAPE